MTSNWKNRWVALALATTMTATTVSSPIAYAAQTMEAQPLEVESTAPESAAPKSTAPESAAPESTAPESAAPESTAPESAAPESAAPESTAPESAAPESAAPESTAPESAVPEIPVIESNWDTAAVWHDGFEETVKSSNNKVAPYWKEGIVAAQWKDMGFLPNGKQYNVDYEIANADKTEGKNALHWHSDDRTARLNVMALLDKGTLDYSKEYVLRMKVKTQNVEGTKGFYARVQVGEKGTKLAAIGQTLTGSNDWTNYEIFLSDLQSIAGDDSGVVKIELFNEYMTGDVWVDQVELVEDYKLTLDTTEATLKQGEKIQLKVQSSKPDTDLSKIVWASSAPDIATVESDGTVSGLKFGVAEITARLDENHVVKCMIQVSDPDKEEVHYTQMRAKWAERLTGNGYWQGENTSPEYKRVVEGFDQTADDILKNFVDNSDTELFSDLDLVSPRDPNSTNTNDSVAFSQAIDRLQNLAIAWSAKGSKYYQNEELKDKILYGMEWAYNHFYHEKLNNKKMFGNWFHWWISIPRSLGGTIILMHDVMSKELLEKEAATLKIFNEDPQYVYLVNGVGGKPKEMVSGNLADTSLVSALRGAAFGDQQAVANSVKYFDKMAGTVTKGEGFYPDGSFIQHTNLAYTGGYGASLLNGVERLMYMTDGTPWQVQENQKKGVFDWIWNGVRPLYVNGAMFDMVSGRGITRPGNNDYNVGRSILQVLALMVDSAPEDMQLPLQQFLKAQLIAGAAYMGEANYYGKMNSAAMMRSKQIVNDDAIQPVANKNYAKAFGAMDKAIAHSETFSFGLSMASQRTGRFEFGNHENKKGWHQSDGATYIYNGDPDQYADNYWNTVDPYRLAGITTDHSDWPVKDWTSYNGSANYVGGASLNQFGAFAMNFKNYSEAQNPNLTAKKAWFVFDDEIVALGAGIQGIDKTRTTETIVENKKVKDDGSNQLIVDGKEYQTNKESVAKDVQWAWLQGNKNADAMGYYFPDGSDVAIKRESRTGSWKDVNGTAGVTEEKVTKNYVSLAVPHGELVDAKGSFKYENYNYVLLPGKTSEQVKAYAENPDIEILANGAYAQAARDNRTNVSSYVFWEQSKGQSVRVGNVESDYGAVIVKDNKETNTLEIAVSSPLQNKNQVKVRIYGNEIQPVEAQEGIAVETDKYGAMITVDTKGDFGMSHSLKLRYAAPSEELLNAYETVRDNYRDGLTGNKMPDKQDPQYRSMMEGYNKAAKAAWESLIKEENPSTLWEDLDMTIDYINKGGNNDHSADFRTATERIRAMSLAYASEGSEYYHNKELFEDIQRALQYVLKAYPTNLQDKVYGNWWTWTIGVPKDLVEIGVLLYHELPPELVQQIFVYVDTVLPSPRNCWMRSSRPYLYTSTAANTMDMGVITAINGAIGNNSFGLYAAADALPLMLKYVTSGDGFYTDGSFKQHGTMAYTGGYGADALRGVAKIASITNGTIWENKEVDSNMVYDWIINGFRPLFSHGAMMEMVVGRQISRYNRNDLTTARYIMDAILSLSKNAPEKYKAELLSFAKTQAKMAIDYDPSTYYGGRLSFDSLITLKKLLADDSIPEYSKEYVKIFAQMDKATIQSKDFGLGISMYSSRSGNAESGNKENHKGWYTGDGALFLYNGDQAQYAKEYWPTVDMTRLPGITTNHVTGNLGNFSSHLSSKDWVGGSSVGEKFASIGMEFEAQFSDLTAKKSWFAFGDQVLALGADITGTEGDYTETIVENRKIKTDGSNKLIVNGKEMVKKLGDTQKVQADWAWLQENELGGSIGYYFPQTTEVSLGREENKGKWQDINTASNMTNEQTAKELTQNYASIAIEHGANPQGEQYEYVLLPGRSQRDMEQYAKDNGIRVLSNTGDLQAAADTKQGIAGFNFWKAGEIALTGEKSGICGGLSKINTNAPASITIYDNNGIFEIGVSDPTQKAESVTVYLEGKNLQAGTLPENVTATTTNDGITLVVDTQNALGATVTAQVVDRAAAAREVLRQGEEFVQKELSTQDLAQAENLLGQLNALDTGLLNEQEQKKREQLLQQLNAIFADMKKAMEVVQSVQSVQTVTKENVEQVKEILAAFEGLTEKQKALLTQEQMQAIETVRELLKQYEESLNPEAPELPETPEVPQVPELPDVPNVPEQSTEDAQQKKWIDVLAQIQALKKGQKLTIDCSDTDYVPGYIITAVKDKGITLVLLHKNTKIVLTAASLVKVNGSLNYTIENLIAHLTKTGHSDSVVKGTYGGDLTAEEYTPATPIEPSKQENQQKTPTAPIIKEETQGSAVENHNKSGLFAMLAVGASAAVVAGITLKELFRRKRKQNDVTETED